MRTGAASVRQASADRTRSVFWKMRICPAHALPKNWRQGIRGKNCPKKEEPVKKRKDLSGRGKAAALLLLFFALTLSSCANREAEELRLSGIELVEKGKYEEAVKKLDEALDKSHGRVSSSTFSPTARNRNTCSEISMRHCTHWRSWKRWIRNGRSIRS